MTTKQKYNFEVTFKVSESELPRSKWVDYLIELFQIGRQETQQKYPKEIKRFCWDLPSKYNEVTDKD